jgi:ABC exporter DevB family membrane fusion protein
VIAVLDNVQKQEALKEAAEQRVRIVETQIAQLLAGEAKEGEIAAQSAKIAQLRAEFDGQTATQGAVIARLETELSRQQTTQTARVARLRAEVANAEAECSRYESLLADGAVSASTRDTKCLAANTADERLNEAQADKDRILGTVNKQLLEAEAILTQIGATYPQQISQAQSTLDKFQEIRAVDIDVLTAQLNEAQIRLAEAEADLELSYIRSPLDGQIVRVYTSPGESIGNEGIVDLAQTQEMYVVAEVYETDIKQIQLGQTAQMSSLALSNQLTGSVEQIGQQVGAKDIINTDPTLQVDARVVEVKIKLDELAMEEAANLINLEVDVQIEVGT